MRVENTVLSNDRKIHKLAFESTRNMSTSRSSIRDPSGGATRTLKTLTWLECRTFFLLDIELEETFMTFSSLLNTDEWLLRLGEGAAISNWSSDLRISSLSWNNFDLNLSVVRLESNKWKTFYKSFVWSICGSDE